MIDRGERDLVWVPNAGNDRATACNVIGGLHNGSSFFVSVFRAFADLTKYLSMTI